MELHSTEFNQNKISLNTGVLLKSFLIILLLLFLINFDFLLPHTTHFDKIIIPLFIDLEICKIMFFVFSLHFRQ